MIPALRSVGEVRQRLSQVDLGVFFGHLLSVGVLPVEPLRDEDLQEAEHLYVEIFQRRFTVYP